jgi:hypothetical protein
LTALSLHAIKIQVHKIEVYFMYISLVIPGILNQIWINL